MRVFVLGTRGFPNVQGGVERHCEELYKRLVKFKGVNITVFVRTSYIPKGKRVSSWHNVNFIYLWCPRIKGFEAFVHTFLACLICILKKPEIAHIHNIGPGLFVPILKLFRIKVVLTYHSVNYLHRKWGKFAKIILKIGEYLSIKFANRIIVISKEIKIFLENKYNRKELELIPNGVNIAKKIFKKKTLKKYNLEHSKYIFCVSRFVPEKGLHDLIDAYLMIEKPDFKLVIAGGVDYEDDYSKNILNLVGQNDNIILVGFVYNEELMELYQNASLFVLPSYFEGLSISLLEALSCCTPVLLSDIKPHRDMLIQEFRFFRVGDTRHLKIKILDLIKRGISKYEKIKIREMLEKNYNWDKIAVKTYRVYEKLFNNLQNE